MSDGAHDRRARIVDVVVPSMRVDVVGAKAFGASRSWFQKGIAGGKVRVGGTVAGKATVVEAGVWIEAAGLGRARCEEILGTTKRGNVKVRLLVERGVDASVGADT